MYKTTLINTNINQVGSFKEAVYEEKPPNVKNMGHIPPEFTEPIRFVI